MVSSSDGGGRDRSTLGFQNSHNLGADIVGVNHGLADNAGKNQGLTINQTVKTCNNQYILPMNINPMYEHNYALIEEEVAMALKEERKWKRGKLVREEDQFVAHFDTTSMEDGEIPNVNFLSAGPGTGACREL